MPEVATPPSYQVQSDSSADLPRMSLLEHLEELRRRIIYSLVFIFVGFLAAFGFKDYLVQFMEAPVLAVLGAKGLPQTLVFTSPTEPFQVKLKIAVLAGVFLASPLILYQVWLFISPGLYRKERSYVAGFLFSTVGLFLAGGFFGYAYVYPSALDILLDYGAEFQPMITISEYANFFLIVILGLGIIFQMPIIILFLALMRVVNASFLWRNFRYAILGIFTVAAILSPTTDVLNLFIFAGPMLALYVISIGLAWLVGPKGRKAATA